MSDISGQRKRQPRRRGASRRPARPFDLPLYCVFAFAMFVGSGECHVWNVKTDGSGDYSTIQSAVNAATSGDSIFVYPGLYDENIEMPFGVALLLRGVAGAAVTIVDGGQRASVLTVRGTATVENMTFRNGRSSVGGGVAFIGASNSIIRDCIVEDNIADDPSLGSGGGIYTHVDTRNITIERSTIRRNEAFNNGGGVSLRGTFATPSGHQLRFNQISENACYFAGGGVAVADAHVQGNVIYGNVSVFSGAGVYVPLDGTALIESNTIVDNHIDNPDGGAGIHADGAPSITRNIIALNTDASHSAYGIACTAHAAQPLVSCNDIWGNGRDEVLCGVVSNDNISVDPQFCKEAAQDFRLGHLSPCLPPNNGCEVLIGALGPGCTVSDAIDLGPSLSTLSISPNPLRTTATIRYGIAPNARSARLAVYDLRGRVVARLSAKSLGASRGSVTWDGRDTAGRPVGAGVYIVRLETEMGSVSRKVTWVR